MILRPRGDRAKRGLLRGVASAAPPSSLTSDTRCWIRAWSAIDWRRRTTRRALRRPVPALQQHINELSEATVGKSSAAERSRVTLHHRAAMPPPITLSIVARNVADSSRIGGSTLVFGSSISSNFISTHNSRWCVAILTCKSFRGVSGTDSFSTTTSRTRSRGVHDSPCQ